jgi:hypothetical protein
MYRASDRFFAALPESHTVAVRVDAYQGGRCIMRDVPISEGSVSVSAGTGVHRTLTGTVPDPALWNLLAPVGTELRAWRGIRYPGGAEEVVPLGVFGLDQQSMGLFGAGGIAISSAPDRWARVQRARFELPRVSEAALTAVQSIVDLVGDVVPTTPDLGGVTTTNTLSQVKTALQVWDRDRDQAIQDLATASGTEVFFGPAGNLVVRDVPVMDKVPAWRVHAGERGVMLAGSASRDRSRVYNVIVVLSTKTDGTPPFPPQIVEDLDPASPTNVNGPYGRAPYFLSTALLANASDARKAGAALLAKTRGRFVDMTVDALVNPCLESGDTVSVTTVGGTALYLVDGFSVPLTVDGKQSLTLRSLAAVTSE